MFSNTQKYMETRSEKQVEDLHQKWKTLVYLQITKITLASEKKSIVYWKLKESEKVLLEEKVLEADLTIREDVKITLRRTDTTTSNWSLQLKTWEVSAKS